MFALIKRTMRRIRKATEKDAAALIQLVNNAYRGEDAKRGWTHEADLISGTVRIDEESVLEMMGNPNAVILKCFENNQLLGCVYLEKQDSRLYLGMLSVSPRLQGGGIGKDLLKAAEDHAKRIGCSSIIMNVISVRKELINWYGKYGYGDTGRRKPFPDDDRFGTPRQPLEFAVLEKEMQPLDTIQ
jgi:ribosomal protein S18 acetylase RimI-like enzyme